jgi:hypothetical protein
MLTNVPIITKLKPVQLATLSSGSKQIAIDQKGGIFLTNLKLNLKTLSAALAEDEKEAINTSVSAIILLGASTITDPNPNDVCLFISEAKASAFKSVLKNIDKFVKKGSREIATCQFTYEGKKDGERFVLSIKVMPAAKMKLIPVTKWLNKLGKLTNLKFEVAAGTVRLNEDEDTDTEETATAVSDSKPGVLAQLVNYLEIASAKHTETPNAANLAAWGKILAKFKQVIAKNPDDASLKIAFKEWLAKYNTAKKQPEAVTEKSESLDDRLTTLENEITKAKEDYSLSDVLQFMSTCQGIRVNPKFKTKLKENSDLMDRFKAIRKSLTAMMKEDEDQLAEVQALLEDPATITDKFQIELDQLWSTFLDNTQTAESFEDILNDNTVTIKESIKAFQKRVETQAKGMLEASKMLKIGDPAEISQQMTVIRSSIVKLKETMATKVKQIDNIAQELAQLEKDFLATEEIDTRKEIFNRIESLTDNFAQHSKPTSIF